MDLDQIRLHVTVLFKSSFGIENMTGLITVISFIFLSLKGVGATNLLIYQLTESFPAES